MKTSKENRKGWLRNLAVVVALAAAGQVFVACGGGGGGGSNPVPIALPVGVGINSFNSANCGGTTAGFIACAIGRSPGFELLVQISAATVGVGGIGLSPSYDGPVIVSGVLNLLAGYGCPAATSYSFTSTPGAMQYSTSYGNLLAGQVTATGTSSLSITFGNTFLIASGAAVTSSTGQSFAYQMMNQIRVINLNGNQGIGGIGGVGLQQCMIPDNIYFLN